MTSKNLQDVGSLAGSERPCWFVGAFWGDEDQTQRFIEKGIWENGHTDKFLDEVNSIEPGDRIAIKTACTLKHSLPFDYKGRGVSTMSIKAVGKVMENLGDGKRLIVDWTKIDPPREWYFHTFKETVWKVMPEERSPNRRWMADNLIGFTFDGQEQDINRFRNRPYWRDRFGDKEQKDDISESAPDPHIPPPISESYSIDDIVEDGCFLEREKLEIMLQRFRDKKNLILQGPPGTGKTWLAKRLALALTGKRDEDKIRPVQFHPNLSYEDFVRGWRPAGDGKLDLVDGPFLQMINAAKDDPESSYVIVIEEINRGNPAQIFGEMLTLLESDKRNGEEALELSYSKQEDERVYIPENLYVIGTMNVADRSIAMVDFALRRRFSFVNLEPVFGSVWRDWVHEKAGIDIEFLSRVEQKMNALNDQIAADTNLGAQFKIGHSYITPTAGSTISDPRDWFRQVVETEISPLLDEYWFDTPDDAQKAREQLLEGV